MPKDPMKVMVEMRGFDFENLCKTFDVSPQSMGIRLATLGYV